MPEKELVDIEGRVVGESAKAYRFDDGTRKVWLPKVFCQWDPDAKVMTVEVWMAQEKELI